MYWGFTAELIYKYQVRWIEMAAIMPLWTHMIVYYVEGNEGHVMNEITGELQWRTAVRGQCFSFVMPWGQMLREYSQRLSRDDWAQLPRGQDCLQYFFRLHLNVAADFPKDSEQVRLRPCVLVHLLVWLWRIRPGLFTNEADIMSRMAEESDSAVRAAAQARVHAEYP